ncbi:uncharacterized protein PAN0_003c2055 [Moesziomyces antarcticus]|uniref:DUF7702 domain-containing protein n=1 Tax=Pseudozyma antarctica TaxID=84753 RepID=A0A5C3FJD5_PSEA2|nr:uncharacterized protein PAN0_003c2055 [Moesziomyces antarcticus]GAK63846.1 conserved hypothetical protein [Moesziomyces antarcticus]SPO44454.1 uncharacterized protein PSANT_02139 [Moesziomyces antarcticus]
MTWPTTTIFDAVFIPLYAIVGVLNLVNVVRHGRGRTVGFISLLIFSLVHLVGNVMLVVEYKTNYASITATVWGYILQSIGLSFLVSSSIGFYTRACGLLDADDKTGRVAKLLNLVNLAALVCVITGYTSTDFTNAQGEMINPKLPVQTKVGALLYVGLIAVIAGLAAVRLARASIGEAKLIRLALLVALTFMLVRAGYAVYATFKGTILVPTNVWVKLVLQYIAEFLALATYTALGFLLDRAPQASEIHLEEAASASFTRDSSSTDGHWQKVPITYVQPRIPPPRA